MPIFEFRCGHCGRKFSALVGVVAGASTTACPQCGHTDGLQKLVSRFARLRSEDESLDALAAHADDLDENDPKAMRRLMKEMAGEMGEDMHPDELEAAMDEEAGAGPGNDEDF